MRCCDHLVVGVFTREDRSTYEWLIRTVTFITWVKDVQPILITNKWSDFSKQVPKCSFAILYHSKTRGRLNVTDVEDSLYDKELDHLSQAYGWDNVIVVIGGMEDSSDDKKTSILNEQPKLGRCAGDVFLFNEIKDNKAPFEGPKINNLKKYIQKRACRHFFKEYFIWLMFLAVLLLITIVVISVCETKYLENTSTLSPPVTVTNATSHFISNMTTTPPPSTIANITSSLTSQTMNTTAQLPDITNSTVNATKLP